MVKKVYLLSNAQRIFTEYEMNYLDITKYFDDILISSDYGTKKPDIRFFKQLIEKYHLDEKKTLMIGNDVRCDINGAKEAGLDTFTFIRIFLQKMTKSRTVPITCLQWI